MRPGWTGTTLTTDRLASNFLARSMATSNARFAGASPSYFGAGPFSSGLASRMVTLSIMTGLLGRSLLRSLAASLACEGF